MDSDGGERLPSELDRLVHDLRGPLNAAAMHLQVLRRTTAQDAVARQSVDTIQEAINRLAALLPAAFAVVAIERGPAARVSLRAVAERATAGLEAGTVTLAGGAWPDVVGDEALLARGLEQLVRNAVRASAGAARPPEVRAEAQGDAVALAVRDWGPPLPSTSPKVLIRLAPAGGAAHRAAGLLAVERIARLHGGALAFASRDDGAEIRLVLPPAPAR